MSIAVHAPSTDLIVPLPGPGERWDPHTVHTHYFSFAIPDAAIGVCAYLRYQPALRSSQGGVSVFRGLHNVTPLDIEFLDYQITMPYPDVGSDTVTTTNGLRFEFIEPGRVVRTTFRSRRGDMSFDVIHTAVTPLIARPHAVPGEELHADTTATRGGFEQFMHCVGELALGGHTFAVDCFSARDRSWGQVRTEDQGGARRLPPSGWAPMHFGPDLTVNSMSYEPIHSGPAWAGIYPVPEETPTHLFGWVMRNGELRAVNDVQRVVLQRHPLSFIPTHQSLTLTDDHGETYAFTGEALAASPIPAWPNISLNDSVFRWQDRQGRTTYCTFQEFWCDGFQRAMARHRDKVCEEWPWPS